MQLIYNEDICSAQAAIVKENSAFPLYWRKLADGDKEELISIAREKFAESRTRLGRKAFDEPVEISINEGISGFSSVWAAYI